MDKDRNAKKEHRTRGFFSRFIEKIDKKMEEKAKSTCSCKPSDKEKNSCCS